MFIVVCSAEEKSVRGAGEFSAEGLTVSKGGGVAELAVSMALISWSVRWEIGGCC